MGRADSCDAVQEWAGLLPPSLDLACDPVVYGVACAVNAQCPTYVDDLCGLTVGPVHTNRLLIFLTAARNPDKCDRVLGTNQVALRNLWLCNAFVQGRCYRAIRLTFLWFKMKQLIRIQLHGESR